MSGLELFRTNINLRGYGAGTEIEIDPDDPGWAADIAKGLIRRVEPDLPRARVSVDGVEIEGTIESFPEGVEPHPGEAVVDVG